MRLVGYECLVPFELEGVQVCVWGGGRLNPPPPRHLHSDVRKKCKKITTCGVESAFVKNAQCVLYMNNVHDT